MTLSVEERRVVDAIDVEAMVASVRELVRIPSWDGQETPAQEYVARLLADSGLDVDRWDIDLEELSRHPAYSAEIDRAHALGVVGSLVGEGGGRTLILNGHVDVVPPGDPALWRHPPFEAVLENGRIHGRGSLDMKGAVVAAVYALRALSQTGHPLKGTVHVTSVVGEEDGGLGTLATILRGYRADGAIVMEPTELVVAPAQAGALNFRIRVPGQSAHGALREEGVSAIENLFSIYAALEALETERNRRLGGDPLFAAYQRPFALCVGTIRGATGRPRSRTTSPSRAVSACRRRRRPSRPASSSKAPSSAPRPRTPGCESTCPSSPGGAGASSPRRRPWTTLWSPRSGTPPARCSTGRSPC